ncbi:hypothetical protein [Geothrix sp. PMB-07]|uniref:hypothetical protein n=1 Tax=Geothrix sp. PMB-07 TaxID=3068640 RepID=UPI0027409029|nr:hypothetical protein [Geothrix sp. PMB-07]WLT32926.1 hypothetical protein Q9293_06230 [Geothrix sp. PMB-07]
MLHAVPELLDALERKLMEGEDPSPLLANIRWSELVWWPEDLKSAQVLKQRIASIQTLLMGLQAPLRATLVGLSGAPAYGRSGIAADAPMLTPRLHEKV